MIFLYIFELFCMKLDYNLINIYVILQENRLFYKRRIGFKSIINTLRSVYYFDYYGSSGCRNETIIRKIISRPLIQVWSKILLVCQCARKIARSSHLEFTTLDSYSFKETHLLPNGWVGWFVLQKLKYRVSREEGSIYFNSNAQQNENVDFEICLVFVPLLLKKIF